MKICFVTDGGRELGMGHVQQSLTVAAELRAQADVCFLTKSDAPVLRMIREAGFDAMQLTSDGEILQRLTDIQPNAVVFDKLDVAEDLARAIKRTLTARLVIFTNLTAANKHADVAITADIGSQFENVTYTDPDTGTRCYYGPKYWVLRREFYEYRRKGKVASGRTDRVLLIFGGSDPADLTSVVLEELLGLDRTFQIDVILGAHFGHDAAVSRVLETKAVKRASVTICRNIKNVAERMYGADLTIASPGLSTFESLCVGTPVIVIPHDSLQRDTYRGFLQMVTRNEVGKLGSMIERSEFSCPSDDSIAKMQIGEGVPELLEEILRPAER